ncbi:MAG: LysM peptidoglycan-binding domain-containing protein [Bryobacteraceae bacterium]
MKINQQPASVVQTGASQSSEFGATVVRVGETTLQQVADRLRLLVELLAQANPRVADPNRLTAGQEIRYPLHPFAQTPATPENKPGGPGSLAQSERDLARQMESAARRKDLAAGPAAPKQAAIPPYDPRKGPQITNDMWTEEMLTGDLSENQLRNIVDPAAFLNARLAHCQQPTSAKWVNSNGSTSQVNPSQMSTREQAEAMLVRLRGLGLQGGEIIQPSMSNPFSYLDYGDDPRRHFQIGGLNVGLLLERYAKYPKDAADRMTLAELQEGAAQVPKS